MTRIIFSSIINDFKNAIDISSHPFRHFTLATSDIDGNPRMRTVVLRKIDEMLNLTIYTDKRSKKITHISKDNSVSLLFSDTERSLQVSLLAKAEIITNDKILQSMWRQVPKKLKKEYTSQVLLEKETKNTASIDYLERKHSFSVITLSPYHIEYLRLKRPDHTRVLFKKENNSWRSTYFTS
ncbi:pyridoxamine 5'-phosphate oxidase family protein [Aquimarina sediminis]|uniref:pyridoxamine 5'-phosphate oxidase family protein n=1 Tax=Aquimarina sediminis TaxID=2070536 RepID=UPI000CA07DD4|nr:pyridoxamine 5'-phosphate oxidase family protein [Aquimarina sediminis]